MDDAVELPLPAVPVVPGLAVEPGALLVEPVLDDDADGLDPMRALVSIHCPERAVLLAVAPAVPLVPVAPDVLLPPLRQPVTVMVRLLLLEV